MGGYLNEFTMYMAAQNGDLLLVQWTQFLYWTLMVLIAYSAIRA